LSEKSSRLSATKSLSQANLVLTFKAGGLNSQAEHIKKALEGSVTRLKTDRGPLAVVLQPMSEHGSNV
jgi:hypothetical protein